MSSPEPKADVAAAAARVVQSALADYATQRLSFYQTRSINHLLAKDIVMFALRGVATAEEFVEAAFTAHESSSEEGVMANTWTAMLTGLATIPVIEAGDMLAEDDEALWVVQIKNSTTTFTNPARIQTLRELQERVAHHSTFSRVRPKPVKAAIGVIRGPDRDDTLAYHGSRTRTENADLQGFEYRYLVGRPFWRWLTGRPDVLELLGDWESSGEQLRAARDEALDRLQADLHGRLDARRLPRTIKGVIELASRDAAPSST